MGTTRLPATFSPILVASSPMTATSSFWS
jgi:hypothetical protein